MKMKTRTVSMLATLATAAFMTTALAQADETLATQAQQVLDAAQPIHVRATITGIDPASRMLTVRGPHGDTTVIVSKDVSNFEQLHVGDRVDVQYKNALLVTADKVTGKNAALRKRVDTQKIAPASGPDGASGFDSSRQVEVIATVERIDKKKHTITLRGPWRTETLDLTPEIAAENLKKGDTVHAVFVSAAAVQVTPVDAAAK